MEIILNLLPWALLILFGLFAISVKEVRIVSSVIVVSALMNMAMAGVYEQSTTLVFLYKGSFDMATGLILLLCYGWYEAKKAPEQAIVFILFAFSHGWLIYEVFVDDVYWFYDYYDNVMVGLTIAHFVVMWDYYEELYKNIKEVLVSRVDMFKEVWSTRGLIYRRVLRSSGLVRDGKPREDNVDNTRRRGSMGPFRSGTYDKSRKEKEGGAGYYE